MKSYFIYSWQLQIAKLESQLKVDVSLNQIKIKQIITTPKIIFLEIIITNNQRYSESNTIIILSRYWFKPKSFFRNSTSDCNKTTTGF